MFKKNFASDNNSGVLPQVFEALQKANVSHAHAYGGDALTEHALEVFQVQFGKYAETHFVFNGTAANVLALRSSLLSHQGVITAETSHLNIDECGAPEATGLKLFTIPTTDGKFNFDQVAPFLIRRGDQHYLQPAAVSITQPTELGTVYTLHEVQSLVEKCHQEKCFVHIDGSRLANAAATLNCSLKQLTADLGVDVISFGGTKNGLLHAEAVVFLNPELGAHFKFVRKRHMQLASKMRFTAAQFIAYFENDLWLTTAQHTTRMAQRLYERVQNIEGVRVTQKRESNAVFAQIPKECVKALREKYFFYIWNEKTFEARWMTSFDTTEADVDQFADALRSATR